MLRPSVCVGEGGAATDEKRQQPGKAEEADKKKVSQESSGGAPPMGLAVEAWALEALSLTLDVTMEVLARDAPGRARRDAAWEGGTAVGHRLCECWQLSRVAVTVDGVQVQQLQVRSPPMPRCSRPWTSSSRCDSQRARQCSKASRATARRGA